MTSLPSASLPGRAAGLLALLFAAGAAADEGGLPGRFFFSPAERRAFDLQRHEKAAPPPAPLVSGIVRRSSGRDTVWLDGQAQPADRGARRSGPTHDAPELPRQGERRQ